MIKLSAILAAFILLSCAAPKPIALKGSYPTPVIIETDKTFDQVWDKLIDLFAQKGLSIKVIDRSSGLIVSERATLPATTENNLGVLKDTSAFVVSPKIYHRYAKKYYPVFGVLTGEWNVRIKKSGERTLINVNVVNIVGSEPYVTTIAESDRDRPCTECRSTGVFEKFLSGLIR